MSFAVKSCPETGSPWGRFLSTEMDWNVPSPFKSKSKIVAVNLVQRVQCDLWRTSNTVSEPFCHNYYQYMFTDQKSHLWTEERRIGGGGGGGRVENRESPHRQFCTFRSGTGAHPYGQSLPTNPFLPPLAAILEWRPLLLNPAIGFRVLHHDLIFSVH